MALIATGALGEDGAGRVTAESRRGVETPDRVGRTHGLGTSGTTTELGADLITDAFRLFQPCSIGSASDQGIARTTATIRLTNDVVEGNAPVGIAAHPTATVRVGVAFAFQTDPRIEFAKLAARTVVVPTTEEEAKGVATGFIVLAVDGIHALHTDLQAQVTGSHRPVAGVIQATGLSAEAPATHLAADAVRIVFTRHQVKLLQAATNVGL
jgi:hypothetical protein